MGEKAKELVLLTKVAMAALMKKTKQVLFKTAQKNIAIKIEQRLSELDEMLRYLTAEERGKRRHR
ncbi:hypothetical protein ACFPFP_41285 [Bradyrhizobium sp. GCM10023182]|uniref:Uncharacterized protein n=1 Tax=Bradyrhizobium zhengyangense TaxID=2911009 RepID=A0ABS9M2A5_9BRAD|nr:hypothetical protein [Bradyrhizobium zhengyangense]MCG2673286.1 hypothetical protein [Bradyrhizobium zhengyangense]